MNEHSNTSSLQPRPAQQTVPSPASAPRRPWRLLAPALALAAAGVVALALSGGHQRTARHAARAKPHGVANHASFSRTATLSVCSADVPPRVLFPAQTPFRRTGAGAIVFAGGRSCRPGAGSIIAALDGADRPAPPRALAAGEPLAAAATAHGQIALVAGGGKRVDQALLSEGPADGAFSAPQPLGSGGTVAAATAYLGDVAFVYLQHGAVQLSLQRYYTSSFAAPVALGGTGGERALAVALDYRTDALAVWWQHGWLYARERHANGPLGPLQRFAKASAAVQLSVLISDDGRAIVAWADPRAHGADVYLDISAPGMRLGPGRAVQRLRFAKPPPANAAVKLVRLSNESVLMAWTGTSAGHFVVRAAGIDLQGLRTTATLSPAGQDALLADLATGPHGDAVALWSGIRRAGGRPHAAILAAWGVPSSRGVPRFGPPRTLAPATTASSAAVAVDPRSGGAIAVWREANGAIRYTLGHAVRPARRPAADGQPSGSTAGG